MFLLFAHDLRAPRGGAADCVGVFGSVVDAEAAAPEGYEVVEIAQVRGGDLVVIRELHQGRWRDCGPLGLSKG